MRCTALVALIAINGPSSVLAQRRPEDQQSEEARQASAESSPAVIEVSAPIANLFTRAEEGIQRGDWKFAIDSLQRIIDDPQRSLVLRMDAAQAGGALYESARRRAMWRIATLPPQGLRAYRLLYDGKAKRLFERAMDAHDEETLRFVVERYLLTRYGDDAADLLASWALDAGRPAEALALVLDVRALVPDRDVPEQRLVAKLVMANAWLGRTADAAAGITEFRKAISDSTEPPDWPGDLAELASVIPGKFAADTPEATSWPRVGGSPARHGVMPPVTPTLVENTPWTFELPGAAGFWERVFTDDLTAPLALPASQLVSDAGRLYVRTPTGCVALDMEDLAVLWTSPPLETEPDAPGVRDRPSARVKPSRLRVDSATILEDYVAGSISVGHGLVFVVMRSGPDITGDGTPRRSPSPHPTAKSWARASHLVAYDADTGMIRWHRGGTTDPHDALSGVEFRSTPISVGDNLWVTYFRQRDLYVAVLDPADGSLVSNILLCSVRQPVGRRGHALRPAADQRVVYVPTGHGVLFAIDRDDYAPRWASQYRSAEGSRVQSTADHANPWLSSPPVVSDGLVLLAPVDHEELFAFDAASGVLWWSAPVDNGSYIIAADQRQVWLGGRSITCLSVVDGTQRWAMAIGGSPTGRAVLSGNLIHVPTMAGLKTLDAATGKEIADTPLPASLAGLGNMLCLQSAMFSLDPTGVRKFPDLGRMYPAAVARYEADPGDVMVAMQLAWMEFMQGAVARAYQVVKSIPRSALEGDPRNAGAAAHLRVEALLKLAGSEGIGPPEALALLDEAMGTARSASDRLRCGLATGDQLVAAGRQAEAFGALWRLGLSPEADHFLSLGQPVEGIGRIELARRLEKIVADLDDETLLELRGEIEEQVIAAAAGLDDPARGHESARLLDAISAFPTAPTASQHALAKLAIWKIEHRRYEEAEQLLRKSVRLDADPTATLAALMHACQLYDQPMQDLVGALIPCLDEVERRFAPAVLPGSFVLPAETADRSCYETTAGEWTATLRANIDRHKLAQFRASTPDYHEGTATSSSSSDLGAPIVLSSEPVWWLRFASPRRNTASQESLIGATFETPEELKRSLESAAAMDLGPPRFVHLGDPASALFADRVVFFAPGDLVYCQRAGDGELLWHTRLALPESFPDDMRVPDPSPWSRRAVVDGQTAVFSGKEGLFGIGLVTGKRLWLQPYDPPASGAGDRGHNMPMAAADGLVAALPRTGRLALMRMIDGTILWERELRGEPVHSIRMLNEFIVTADRYQQRVHVFDRRDGHIVQRTLFRQPDPKNEVARLVYTGGLLCGPDHTPHVDSVVAVDLATGDIIWRTVVDKPLVQLFKPREGYIGMSMLGGDVQIADAATGEVVLERNVGQVRAVDTGLLFDGTLLLRYIKLRNKTRFPGLVAIDVATNEELWRREDLTRVKGKVDPLQMFSGHVPALIEYGEPNRPRIKRIAVAMIDARSGENVGPVRILQNETTGRFSGRLSVWPGGAVVTTKRNLYGFARKPASGEQGGGL